MFSTGDTISAPIAQRFDPRAKAIAYLLVSGLTLLATRWPALLMVVAGLAPPLAMLRLAAPMLRTLRILLPTLALFAAISYWSGGATAALGAVLRLLALVGTGMLFFGTTSPGDLGDALMTGGLPPRATFMLEGTLRFVPTMSMLLREVLDAQASRGIRFDGIYLLWNGPALLAPLLVHALRFADTLAEALEARGFGSPRRTPLRDYRFHTHDWLLVAATAALCSAVAWLLVA
jgi:energy-coupling factor transport system permease protein